MFTFQSPFSTHLSNRAVSTAPACYPCLRLTLNLNHLYQETWGCIKHSFILFFILFRSSRWPGGQRARGGRWQRISHKGANILIKKAGCVWPLKRKLWLTFLFFEDKFLMSIVILNIGLSVFKCVRDAAAVLKNKSKMRGHPSISRM